MASNFMRIKGVTSLGPSAKDKSAEISKLVRTIHTAGR